MNRKSHYFIYPYDEKKNRSGHTICVMLKEGMIFHGESLCGALDQFSKKVGRELAYDRALASYNRFLSRQKVETGKGS